MECFCALITLALHCRTLVGKVADAHVHRELRCAHRGGCRRNKLTELFLLLQVHRFLLAFKRLHHLRTSCLREILRILLLILLAQRAFSGATISHISTFRVALLRGNSDTPVDLDSLVRILFLVRLERAFSCWDGRWSNAHVSALVLDRSRRQIRTLLQGAEARRLSRGAERLARTTFLLPIGGHLHRHVV